MNENLNLKEILKDCPKGTKFYSSIYGDVYFEEINDEYNYHPIRIKIDIGHKTGVTVQGLHNINYKGECTLFPSKDQRDWSKWHRPFVDGDVVTCGDQIAIFKKYISEDTGLAECYVFLDIALDIDIDGGKYYVENFATEDEREKLFDTLKSKGCKWNAEEKKLENITKESRFDTKDLKPFDKVLVRQHDRLPWCVDFYSYYDEDNDYVVCTGEIHYDYCIPYNDDTAHLIGTDKEAPEYYKYWNID